MKSLGTIIGVVLFLTWTLFYFYTLIHVNQTCDGHVVKNVFDWPVCVH